MHPVGPLWPGGSHHMLCTDSYCPLYLPMAWGDSWRKGAHEKHWFLMLLVTLNQRVQLGAGLRVRTVTSLYYTGPSDDCQVPHAKDSQSCYSGEQMPIRPRRLGYKIGAHPGTSWVTTVKICFHQGQASPSAQLCGTEFGKVDGEVPRKGLRAVR